MLPHSAEYARALTRSHKAVRRVEVWSPGGDLVRTIPATGGNVTVTRDADTRRTCTLQVTPEPDLIPRKHTDPLHPLSGHELRLYAGIRLSGAEREDGSEEWLPVGAYPITSADLTRGPSGIGLEVRGDDRSEHVRSQGWVLPYMTPSGNVATAIEALLRDRWPGITLDLSDMSGVVNGQVYEGSGNTDPWRDARALATDTGHDLAFDADGVARARPVTDPATATPARTYGWHGIRTLTEISRPLSRDEVYTGVVVWAQHPSNSQPWTAVRWDTNPSSPTYSGMTADGTYVGSPLGRRPKWIETSRVGNQTTAEQAAIAGLLRLRGRGDQFRLTLPADASADVDDVYGVSLDAHDAAQNTVVDRIQFPWGPGLMSLELSTARPLEDQ